MIVKQHLLRARQVEDAIRTELLRQSSSDNGEQPSPAARIGVDLLDVRIAVMDKLLAQFEEEDHTPFTVAMERIRQHFDKDFKTPYKTWRGATPANEPSLAKDIVVVFEELVARGVWNGACPVINPRWDPAA